MGQDQCIIEYSWQHTGHEINTLIDLRSTMLMLNVKKWIEDCTNEGLDWPSIKPLLQVNNDILTSICDYVLSTNSHFHTT